MNACWEAGHLLPVFLNDTFNCALVVGLWVFVCIQKQDVVVASLYQCFHLVSL